MMRSMFAGVSGLKTHQAKMDVIGNNIANVNTVGYKAQTVSFQEVFSQTLKGAGSPQGGTGGTNPQQVGLGVNVASMDVNHTQGSTQRTDNPTDVMIDGDGFFAVSNDPNYQNRFYTRAGNFSLDKSGNLVTPGGFKVLDKDGVPVAIDKSTTRTATETGGISIGGNMNSNEEIDATTNIAYTTTVDVYDSLGNVQKLTINFGERLDGDDGTDKSTYRNVQFTNPDMAGAGGDLGLTDTTTPTANASAYYAKFDDTGTFVGLVTIASGDITAGSGVITNDTAVATLALTIDVPGASDIDLTIIDTASTPTVSALANLTHYAGDSDVTGVLDDGNSAGSIDSFSISASGEVVAIFTNGERETLSTIGLTLFDNPAGLMKMGSNMFVDTPNSGSPRNGSPGVGSFGGLVPGALEMSNVDLSAQFTDMITTQRGFQSNSRIITTADEMLQELVNLKR